MQLYNHDWRLSLVQGHRVVFHLVSSLPKPCVPSVGLRRSWYIHIYLQDATFRLIQAAW